MSVRSIRSRTSARSSSSASRLRRSGACTSSSIRRRRGIDASDIRRATRSRGPAVPRATRRDEPLDVVDVLQHLAELAAVGGAKGELLDGVQAIANPLERDQRAQQPRAEHPSAHRRDGAIDLVEQRTLRAAFAAGDDLEMLERDRIDQQALGDGLIGDRAHMGEVGLLRVAQVRNQTARRLDGADAAIEAEAVEPVRLQLIKQRSPSRFGLEAPGVRRCDGNLEARDLRESVDRGGRVLPVRPAGDDDLARAQRRDFVGKRLESFGAVIFSGREFARG